MKRAFGRLLILALLVALAGGGVALWCRQRLHTPYHAFAGEEVFVELPAGLSLAAIADRLTAAGVIPEAWTFRLAARVTGADRRLKAGEYRFAGPSTPSDVMSRLVAGDVFAHSVTFPEGLTIVEMAEIFGRSGLGTPAEFIAAAADPSLVAAFDSSARSLEGYLFPDTYAWPRREGAADAVRAMVGNGHAGAGAVVGWVRPRQAEVERIRSASHVIAGSGLTLSKLSVAASLLGDLAKD